MASIEINNVSVVFGAKEKAALEMADQGISRSAIKQQTGAILGVHNCNLTVQEGKTLVLIGLSGSGKSTLLRTVNRLAKVSRGEVHLTHQGAQFAVHALQASDLQYLRTRLVSMVFQQFGLLPWRSVTDNVGLGLEIANISKRQAKQQIMEQLELVGLTQWADRPVTELSGGMQQRVGLARAFATSAPVLLMDEPFSALDQLIRQHLQQQLLMLQSHFKKTVIFVSHDLNEAIQMGDSIALMQDGRIVQQGTPKEIILAPVNDHVAEFVSHMNPLTFLTAADIMRPYDSEAAKSNFSTIAKAETPIGDLITALDRRPGNIGISDKKGFVGILSSSDIITHLAARMRR